MGTAAQFVSLDGTALDGETVDFRASENALARRSISIFSRRGVEDTPEPRPPFIAQGIMRPTREMSERQKRWLKRRSTPAQSSSPNKSRGTVLNAVPAAKTIRMTPLEEEMASSPNEEILSALESPSSLKPASASPITPRSGSFWATKDTSPSQRAKSTKRKSTNTRIGVWMNGIAHWDEHARLERSAGSEEPSLPETGFAPMQPMPADQLNALRSSRPQLSVVIPGSEPLVNDTTISTIVRGPEMASRGFVSVAPANIVSKFASAPEESHAVSPLEATEAPRIIVENEHGTKENVIRQSQSSSSEGSLAERDDSSSYSRRSSATSIEAEASRAHELKLDSRAQARSIVGDISAAPSDEGTKGVVDVNKPLPPCPAQDETPTTSPMAHKDTIKIRHVNSTRSEPVLRSERPTKSWRAIELDHIDSESARSSYLLSVSAPPSPTLSQAEQALEAELCLIDRHVAAIEPPTKRTLIHRADSVRSVMQPPERAPTVPRRSRKREWRLSRNLERAAVQPAKIRRNSQRRRRSEADLRRPVDDGDDSAPATRPLRRSWSSFDVLHRSATELAGTCQRQAPIIEASSTLPQVAYEDGLIVLEGPVTLQKVMDDAALTTASAEEVLLHILEALPSTTDLFNTAMINKCMYRVFKENEMHLIRVVMRNQSVAAWELREWCPLEPNNAAPLSAASSQPEHTPISYMRGHRRDLEVIQKLKVLILERCQTFIRRETALALGDRTHPDAQRFDDAFFRICTFCSIFGSGKGREEDITGQLDWLKGGLLAHSADLSATMNMNLEFEMSSVLLNPPEHFARSNEGGLTAQQLYDLTEIWGCLTSLLQPYQGQTRQATRCGVFDACEVFDGDEEREEYLLEEWTAHLLTLGPAVVLEMAASDSASGFALARANGWTHWTPPQTYSGSRTAFFKEPVARLYEERVAAAARALRSPAERERKEMSRRRVATLAAEIRLTRQSSMFKRLPVIDQASEKAMSVLERRGSAASAFSFHASPASPRRPPAPPITRTPSISPDPSTPLPPTANKRHSRTAAPHFSTPRPLEPKTLIHSRRKISPIIEDKVESFNRLTGTAGVGEAAIRRITEMGFSRAEAEGALRETDGGDGVRVEWAVEKLLG